MLKNILGGVAVGIANIIPGVSGGTMMVVLGIFDKLMASINNIFKKDNPNRFNDILFLVQVLVGAGIGLVGFAKIIEFLFNNVPTQTMYWFIGLILFSIPTILKKELRGHKLSIFPFIIGLAIIFVIVYFNPGKQSDFTPVLPPNTMFNLIKWVFVGMIAGATMLLPGVSGSMILLILGQYYYFKTYVSSVTDFEISTLIPLGFIFIGIFIGIVLSAKVTSYFINKNRRGTISFILGLIVASSIVLIPINEGYNLSLILSSLVALLFGGFVVLTIERFVE